jgi:hypothetical protein
MIEFARDSSLEEVPYPAVRKAPSASCVRSLAAVGLGSRPAREQSKEVWLRGQDLHHVQEGNGNSSLS